MKTIKTQDIKSVRATDLKPGMIIAEGVVVETSRQTETLDSVGTDEIFIYTAADGYTGVVPADRTVQVYGVLSDIATEALVEAVKADRYSSSRG